MAFVGRLFQALAPFAQTAINFARTRPDAVANMFRNVINAVPGAAASVMNGLRTIGQYAGSAAQTAGKYLGYYNTAKNMVNAVPEVGNFVREKVNQLPDKYQNALKTADNIASSGVIESGLGNISNKANLGADAIGSALRARKPVMMR